MPIRKTYRVCYLIVINLVFFAVLSCCTSVPKKTVSTIETKPRHHPTFKTPENVPFNQEPATITTYVGIGTRTIPPFVIDPHATNKPPSNLSQDIAWRPARHFGAWNKGSDFGDINILLNGMSGSWFFNDYFTTMPVKKQRIYKQYYRWNVGDPLDSVTLPSDVTTELVHLPGGQPEASAGANNILLSLQQIDKTSKYGGSIKLVFKMADVTGAHGDNIHFDNFEYEFAHIGTVLDEPVTTLFNVDDVRLNIYVAPHPDEFNRTRSFGNKCKVLAEIDIDGVTAIQNDVRIENETAYQNLKEMLPAIGAGVANNRSPNYRAPHACALVQGFLHDQFQNELGELTGITDIVDKILISDHFIDVFTREGQAVLTADWQITLIRIDTELGKDEPELTWFRVGHKYVDSYTNFTIIGTDDPAVRLEHMGASPTYALGNWLIDEICPEETPSEQLLEHVHSHVGILEADPWQISNDDYMRTTEQIFPAPYCATIRATISSGQWGPIVDFADRVNLYRDDFSHEPSNLYLGFYNYRAAYRLSVR